MEDQILAILKILRDQLEINKKQMEADSLIMLRLNALARRVAALEKALAVTLEEVAWMREEPDDNPPATP